MATRRHMVEIVKAAGADIGVLGGIAALNSDTTEQNMINGAIRRTADECCRAGLLIREYSFYTVSGQASYALPADYMLPWINTTWNRNDQWPMRGISQREWQANKSGFTASSVHQRYRIQPQIVGPGVAGSTHLSQKRFFIDPTPTSSEKIVFNYRSDHWLQAYDLAVSSVTDMLLSGTDEIVLTLTSHDITTGDVIAVDADGTLPAGLGRDQAYSISSKTTNTISLQGTNSTDFGTGTTDTIEDITLTGTDPVQITATAHGMSNGDQVRFADVGGTEISYADNSGTNYVVASVAADTFDLSGTDSSDFTAWTSGGTFASWTPAATAYKLTNTDKLISATGTVYWSIIPDELIEQGIAYRLRQRMGMSYFDHKEEYERVLASYVGAAHGDQIVNMSSAPRNNYVGIPEGNFTSN